MAVRINIDKLSEDQKTSVRKYLYMQPKVQGFFKKKRFFQSKDPILLYSIDKPKNEIILPYTFANKLLNKHVNSEREYPTGKFNFKGTLRENQIPVMEESLSYLKQYGTTTLGLYPGFGKSICSSYLASKLEGLTLIVYPIKIIEQSWYNTFNEFTDASIWLNDGKNSLPESCNVILTMDTQFHKIPSEVLSMVKILIIDEAHMFCVPSRIYCLLGTTPKYIIACTATLERSDGMESIIHAVCGTHGIFKKSEKRFSVYRLFTGIKTEIEKNKMGDPDWSKLVKKLCEDSLRNSFIIDLVEKNYQHKIMILTWNKAHAFYLAKTLQERGISADVLAGNKNSYKDSRVLVGTSKKLGTGFDELMTATDFAGVKSNMMILTGSTKSLSGLDQWVGRVFRSNYPTIIDFVDDNKICKRHWTQRRKFYEDPDRNGEIHYIEMKKEENSELDGKTDQEKIKSIHSKMVSKAKKSINNKL